MYNPETLEFGEKSSKEQTASVSANAAGIGSSIEGRYCSQNEALIKYVGRNLSHENASAFILEYLKKLKEVLKINYSLILIDECSDISKDGQIEVFRLLKLIRGASGEDSSRNYAYFTAAVYPPQATYYPSRINGDSINFDLGQDCSVEYLRLDELAEEYEEFFKQLIIKRLEFVEVNGLSKNPEVLEIFDTERAFLLAVYAAEGIPRRFFEILKQAYDNLQQRFKSDGNSAAKLSSRDIEIAIQIVAENFILAKNKLEEKDFMILDELISRISKRNKKAATENEEKEDKVPANLFFTVGRGEANRLSNLLIQGVVHDKGRTRLRKYYKEEGLQGILLKLDAAVSFLNSAIERTRAVEILRDELKINAKRGYMWCQDFKLSEFQAFSKKDVTSIP